MNHGKYVIVDVQGVELAILFDPIIPHKRMTYGKPVSAGFFNVVAEKDEIKVGCFGDSETLKLRARPNDARIIEKLLDRLDNS